MPSPWGRTGWGKKTNIIFLLSSHPVGVVLIIIHPAFIFENND